MARTREASAKQAKARYWQDPAQHRAVAKKRRLENPEAAARIQRKYREKVRVERWAEQLIYSIDRDSKRARFGPHDIDADYLRELYEQQGGRCYWLGIPMVPSPVTRDPRRPSMDRLDNSKGYVRGNVVLACQFANLGRSTTPADAFASFVQEMRGHMSAPTK